MRNTTISVVALVVFAAAMLAMKFVVAPEIASHGWIAVLAFVGGCLLIAVWIDGRSKRLAKAQQPPPRRSAFDDGNVIDAEFRVIEPKQPTPPVRQPGAAIVCVAVGAAGLMLIAAVVAAIVGLPQRSPSTAATAVHPIQPTGEPDNSWLKNFPDLGRR